MTRFNYFCLLSAFITTSTLDLTLIGFHNKSDGIGSYISILRDAFHKEFSIQTINARNPKPKKDNYGPVILFTGLLFENDQLLHHVAQQKSLKIALSTFESTRIPKSWVNSLNTIFDLVCVTDQFLVDVYQKSGVTIPLFVLPSPVLLTDFYNFNPKKIVKKQKCPFVFGMTGDSWAHKNHILLAQAFHKEFGDNPDIQLLVHTKGQVDYFKHQLQDFFINNKASNISFIDKNLTDSEYLDFFASLDCYVLVSQGEGFSITPRQAMALGIPTIVSNNSAHKTLCSSNFVLPVQAGIQVVPDYLQRLFAPQEHPGYQYTCTLLDVQKALREMYENYAFYSNRAQKSRQWVMQYDFSQLKNKYRSLIKPKKVVLGQENTFTDQAFITNSKKLYKKYNSLY